MYLEVVEEREVAQEKLVGESAEMYLKTIAELAVEREPVPVTGIAERLEISTVSASEMVHRLQDRGLVEHTPYKGVQLTSEGSRRANIVIRRHRLWECFLVEKLGIPWELVHGFACRLEHAADDEVVGRLADFLDAPAVCPHGNPIPTAEGEMPAVSGLTLLELGLGESGVVLRIQLEDEYDVLCSYLAKRGIHPGAIVRIEEIAPLEGPLSIRIGQQVHALGRRMAQQVIVERQTLPGGNGA